MAPVQYALETDQSGMGGFVYKDLLNSPEGALISYFNGQFYTNYSAESYNNVINNGYPSNKVVMGMIFSQDINNNIDVVNITWNKVTEIEDLLRIDIGVYPLIDEEWVIGKSGLKALQYMALGIPTVASKYGNIIDIIDHMNDGILIENKRDWIKYLQKLIYDIKLRKKLGQNSRQKIIKNYTTEIIKDSYLKIFDY